MQLRMLQTVRGAEDGFTVLEYRAGQTYTLANTPRGLDLAGVFLRERWAEEIEKPLALVPPLEDRGIRRLPLLDEYIASGYRAENYAAFLKEETEACELAGFKVEVRTLNDAERAHIATIAPTPPAPPVEVVPEVVLAPPIPAPAPTPVEGSPEKAAKRKGK